MRKPIFATGQVHPLLALKLLYFPRQTPPWCAQVTEAMETKYLAQGLKHVDTSVPQTHGQVIRSPALLAHQTLSLTL